MVMPVLVVDDSAFARKMLISSLPKSWDATITEAANGREALVAYRAGKGEVIFLDLTMPDIDGFEVLEALRAEDLNCLVIVVSADIQPLAQSRVMQLGAVAFIQKPVNAEKVEAALQKYGLDIGSKAC
jgi:two-component system, chemotaxis family, chemotaxis protein CheY